MSMTHMDIYAASRLDRYARERGLSRPATRVLRALEREGIDEDDAARVCAVLASEVGDVAAVVQELVEVLA